MPNSHGLINWRSCLLGLASAVAVAGCQLSGDKPHGHALQVLSDEISSSLAQGQTLAVDPVVDAQLADIAAEGQRGIVNGNQALATAQLNLLKDMNERLAQVYDLRIVSRPGEDTGFWRQPVDNPQVRNYYVVVEALAPGGRVLSLPVSSIETQTTESVTIWAQRVNESTFDRIRAEKEANGLIVDSVFGHKARGELDPVFDEPVPGGAITNWDD